MAPATASEDLKRGFLVLQYVAVCCSALLQCVDELRRHWYLVANRKYIMSISYLHVCCVCTGYHRNVQQPRDTGVRAASSALGYQAFQRILIFFYLIGFHFFFPWAPAKRAAASGRGPAREEIEQGLKFEGFVAFVCKVRRDSAEVVASLRQSSHHVAMATGDSALTAVFVGTEVGEL